MHFLAQTAHASLLAISGPKIVTICRTPNDPCKGCCLHQNHYFPHHINNRYINSGNNDDDDDDSYCFVLLVEISLIALETKVQGPSDSPMDGWMSQCPIVRGGRISYGTSFPYLCIDYRKNTIE